MERHWGTADAQAVPRGVDLNFRAERQTPAQARLALSRALLLSIPIATLAFVPLDFISGAEQTFGLTAARAILILSFGIAAWRLPQLSPTAASRVFLVLSVVLSLAMALLCQGTGGATSPAFGFMWALPLAVGLLFMHEPGCPLVSGVSSLPLGAWLLAVAGKSNAEMAYWLGVTFVGTGIATTASVLYRRLQRLEVRHEKTTEKRLAHNDRLASLGSLAAGMAHEINSPLACLSANLSYLLDVGATTEPKVSLEALTESQLAAERIGKLVRELLIFSRADGGSREKGSCDLHRQIEMSLSLARAQLHGRAEAITEFGPVGEVRGAGLRIGQVFLNLFINAAQAMPASQTHNQIRISTRLSGDGRVVAEVRDNGMGIRPEVLPRIFDPFFTTKDVGEGTGLGLSICHGILKEIGGDIEVESELGKGTVFRIFLQPATAAAS